MKRILMVCAVLLTALFATGCNCSCCRKGIVLRGDWSLELNRVSNMKSNGPQYQSDCDACDFDCAEGVPGGCVDGCTMGPAQGGSAGCGRTSMLHRRGGEYYDEFSEGDGRHPAEPPQPTAAAQTRFHPVPTKPVFEPEYGPELLEPVRPAATSNAGWKSKRRA